MDGHTQKINAAIAGQTAAWKPHRRISLDRVGWNAAVEDDFRRIPNDCPIENVDLIRGFVSAGRAQALAVNLNGENVGTLVVGIENMGHGFEYIIWCAFLRGKTTLSAPVMQMLIDHATANGCKSIRLSTIHEGLARWLEKTHGFRASEIIMRKDI
jgi:hypothetical protein